jgi:hypothetical protein
MIRYHTPSINLLPCHCIAIIGVITHINSSDQDVIFSDMVPCDLNLVAGDSGKHTTFILRFVFIWFVRLLALRPLLAYCASLG